MGALQLFHCSGDVSQGHDRAPFEAFRIGLAGVANPGVVAAHQVGFELDVVSQLFEEDGGKVNLNVDAGGIHVFEPRFGIEQSLAADGKFLVGRVIGNRRRAEDGMIAAGNLRMNHAVDPPEGVQISQDRPVWHGDGEGAALFVFVLQITPRFFGFFDVGVGVDDEIVRHDSPSSKWFIKKKAAKPNRRGHSHDYRLLCLF
jgi:hypothetical protein